MSTNITEYRNTGTGSSAWTFDSTFTGNDVTTAAAIAGKYKVSTTVGGVATLTGWTGTHLVLVTAGKGSDCPVVCGGTQTIDHFYCDAEGLYNQTGSNSLHGVQKMIAATSPPATTNTTTFTLGSTGGGTSTALWIDTAYAIDASNPATPTPHAALLLGDSHIFLGSANTESYGALQGHSVRNTLQEALVRDTGEPWKVYHKCAHGGDGWFGAAAVTNCYSILYQYLFAIGQTGLTMDTYNVSPGLVPSVVFVHAGVNDLRAGGSVLATAQTLLAQIEVFLAFMMAHSPKTKVVVDTPPWVHDNVAYAYGAQTGGTLPTFTGSQEMFEQARRQILSLPARYTNCRVSDSRGELNDRYELLCDTNVTPDGLHGGGQYYRIIGTKMAEVGVPWILSGS